MVGRLQKGRILLFLVGLILFSLGCRLSLQEESRVTTLNLTYQIDPQTLLDSLANGDPEAFVLLTATPQVYPDYAQEPVMWTVSDYSFVANKLYQHAKNDTLDDWKLNLMSFNTVCRVIDFGFQNAIFGYFKSVPTQDGSSRLTANLYVDPTENTVSILEEVYTPDLNQWESIDLSQVTINAFDALQIADANGGKEFLASVNNHCTVLALYDAEGKYEGWYVTYFNDELSFRMNIDAETGEFRIVR